MVNFYETVFRSFGSFGLFLGLFASVEDFANVEYKDSNGDRLFAYLATPPDFDTANANKTYPVALLFHASFGLDEDSIYYSDSLAEEGEYIVLAPDLLRGVSLRNAGIFSGIYGTMAGVRSCDSRDPDVDAAIQYLESEFGSKMSSVLVSGPGFGVGGSESVRLASRRNVNGTVFVDGIYTNLYTDPTDEDVWGLLGSNDSPILGIYPGAEPLVTTSEEIAAFEAGLQAINANYEITIYDDANLASFQASNHQNGEEYAVKAWEQILSFMTDISNTTTM